MTLKQLILTFEGGSKHVSLRRFANHLIQLYGGSHRHAYIDLNQDKGLDAGHILPTAKSQTICKHLIDNGIDANLAAKRLCRTWNPFQSGIDRARRIINRYYSAQEPALVPLIKPVTLHVVYAQHAKPDVRLDTTMALQSGTRMSSHFGSVLRKLQERDPEIQNIQDIQSTPFQTDQLNQKTPSQRPAAARVQDAVPNQPPQVFYILVKTPQRRDGDDGDGDDGDDDGSSGVYESIDGDSSSSSNDSGGDQPQRPDPGADSASGGGGGSKEPGAQQLFVHKVVSDPPGPTALSAQPKLSREQVVTLIRTNIPIYHSNNSCYLDVQLVALLFDRTSPYFRYFSRDIWQFFDDIGQQAVLFADRPLAKPHRFNLMDRSIVQAINARARNKVHRGKMGATGGLEELLTGGKLNAYHLDLDPSQRDPFKVVCMEGPFAVLQLEATRGRADRPTADAVRTYETEFNGQTKTYRIHAICGLRGGHWQTLIYVQGAYYLVDVVITGVNVAPFDLETFMMSFDQHRIYYVCDDCQPVRTVEQLTSCERAFKQHVLDYILGIVRNPDTSDQMRESTMALLPHFGDNFENILTYPLDTVLEHAQYFIPTRLAVQIKEFLHQYAGGVRYLDSAGRVVRHP